MATLEQLQRALIAADQAGNAEDARALAAEIRKMSAGELPVERPTGLSRTERFKTGLADPIHGGAQLLTQVLPEGVVRAGNEFNNWLADKTGLVAKLPEGGVDQQVREREQAYQAQRGGGGVDWWRMAGNVVSPATIALASAGGAPAAMSLPAKMAMGGALGAGSSAMQPVTQGDFAGEKAKQMLVGGAAGAVVPALVAGASRVISPKASVNPQLELLKREGVRPTIGQSLGGAANATEEKLQSVPILGDAIKSARGRALNQFNSAAINRAVKPLGRKIDGTGQQAVDKAHDAVSAAYEQGKQQLGSFQLDRQAARELNNLRKLVDKLPEQARGAFDDVWNILDSEVDSSGRMVAEGFKKFDSKAGMEASRFMRSPDAYQQHVGTSIKELNDIIVRAGSRANPQAGALLRKADRAFANLVRVENAAARAANNEGVFTPGQLNMAVRAGDMSARKNLTARGKALMQDLAGAGQSVLGNKVPNSGTFDRFAVPTMIGTGYLDWRIPAGLLGSAGLYTQPGQALLRGAVSARPDIAQPIAGMLNQSSPMLAPAGGLLAYDIFNQ